MIVAFTGAGISKASGIDTFQDNPEFRGVLTRKFANEHPEEYRAVMQRLVDMMEGKKPNDAHIALAEYNIPVITMNIDGLHSRLRDVIAVHGRLPTRKELSYCDTLAETPVLYGDMAPMYVKALDLIDKMQFGDTLLVIGASDYTNFSNTARLEAITKGASIVEIQDNAETKVRQFLERRRAEWK